jgi:hypothetical protein
MRILLVEDHHRLARSVVDGLSKLGFGSAPKSSLPFVHRIIEYVESEDAEWAIFTATKPLRALLRKERLNMVDLAPAEQMRVPNPADWGTYFKHDPRVMAVNHFAVFESARLRAEPAPLGVAALA